MRRGYVHPWLGSGNAHRRGSLAALTDDDSGRLVASADGVDVALGGAMLIELTLLGRVDVAGPGESVRRGRLLVKDAGPTPDPLLDEALALLVESGQVPAAVVGNAREGHAPTAVRQADRPGLLRAESRKVLGIFPSQQWPTEGRAAEESVRILLAHALRVGATDNPALAALVSALRALDVVQKVVAPALRAVRRR